MNYEIKVNAPDYRSTAALRECFTLARMPLLECFAQTLTEGGDQSCSPLTEGEGFAHFANLQAFEEIRLITKAERLVLPYGWMINEDAYGWGWRVDKNNVPSLELPQEPLNFPPTSIMSVTTYFDEGDAENLSDESLEEVVLMLEELCPPGVTVRRFA